MREEMKKVAKHIIFCLVLSAGSLFGDQYLGVTESGSVEMFSSSGERIAARQLEAGEKNIQGLAYGDLLPVREGNELAVLEQDGGLAVYEDPFEGKGTLALIQDVAAGPFAVAGLTAADADGGVVDVSSGDSPGGVVASDALLVDIKHVNIFGAKHAPYIAITAVGGEWALLGVDGYAEVFSGNSLRMVRDSYFKPGPGAIDIARTSDSLYAVLYDDNRVHFRRLTGSTAGGDMVLKSSGKVVAFSAEPEAAVKITGGKDIIWVDAAAFDHRGGWLLDTKFIHLMGCPYLIAAGVGTPVENARTSFAVSEPGTYRVWVRARNWIQEHSPGRFNVQVNGQKLAAEFGAADSDQWVWEPGGELTLAAGEHHLELVDKTGFYGRCAAVVLSKNPDYVPPHELKAFQRERARLTGISTEPRDYGAFDVIVVGGGTAGCPAALAAARSGARTALIHNRSVLGGNASSELGVPVNGAGRSHAYARETGICEELGRMKAFNRDPKMSLSIEAAVREEPNLTVFMNQHVMDAEVQDGRIVSVEAMDTHTGELGTFSASQFIDTTGDGWLGYYAGADYRVGREAQHEYTESLAPETADNKTMSGCLMGEFKLGYGWKNAKQPVSYSAPEWAYQLPPNPEFGRSVANLNGQWWLEYPNQVDDVWEAEYARDELIRIVFGYWDFLKNKWEKRDSAKNAVLTYVPITEAKRESRRLLGDYVLNQNDVLSARMFPDVIGHAGWSLDIHHPEGILSGEKGQFDFDETAPLNNIPFRSLYSRNINNLLFAGRCMSVTHVALGTVRIEATCMVTGQAAGTAAALCAGRGILPRELGQKYIQELQQELLKDDQYVPGIANADPNDLARKATVSASSTSSGDQFDEQFLAPDGRRESGLGDTRFFIYESGKDGYLGTLNLYVKSGARQDILMPIRILGVTDSHAEDLSDCPVLRETSAVIPAGYEGYVTFDIQTELPPPFFAVETLEVGGVRLPEAEKGHLGARAVWRRRPDHEFVNIGKPRIMLYSDPPLVYPRNYEAQNVINGTSRTVGTEPNMWKSDPQAGLPQWIQLKWESPQTFSRVHLTFDTNLDYWRAAIPLPPEMVTAYEVQIQENGHWVTIIQESENLQRFREHQFPEVTADQLRVVVKNTGGDPSSAVYELRVY